MSKVFLLKGTSFSVDYDLPKDINEARKALWSELKHIESPNPKAKVQIVYPAKLLVDSKVVRDQLPEWAAALKGDRLGDCAYVNENALFERPNPSDFTHRSSTVEMPRDNPVNNEWGYALCKERTAALAAQYQLRLIMEHILFNGGCGHFGQVT